MAAIWRRAAVSVADAKTRNGIRNRVASDRGAWNGFGATRLWSGRERALKSRDGVGVRVVLDVLNVSMEMIMSLRPLVAMIAKHDSSLSDQVTRSGSRAALALGEGIYSRKGNQPARFQEALASAGETRTALGVAIAWGYVTSAQAQSTLELIDRVVAMTWKLTHRSGGTHNKKR
jgi:four helix bundle protein